MRVNKNQKVFFELVRAGLFPVHGEGVMVNGSFFEGVDWGEVYRLAEEQSVVGLIADAIDCFKFQISGFKIPQAVALQFIGQTMQIEQRNKAMNAFVAELIELLRKNDIYALLVKGQGIAQCYQKPLWRACGDVDLLLSEDNYKASIRILKPMASSIDEEQEERKHLALTIDGWTVELHGTLRTNLWSHLERVMDDIQRDVFYGGEVRSTQFQVSSSKFQDASANHNDSFRTAGAVQVFLPGPDEDVVFVFAHILQHFYIEGIGMRQICDWCRLLWTYRDAIDHRTLDLRLRKAGMMKEWKAFASFAVEYLGMPEEAMPFYESRFKAQGSRVMELVMDSGNFGQGKDKSYKLRHSKGASYMISFGLHAKDGYRRFRLFPAHALLMWWKLMMHGLKGVLGIGKNDGGL